MHEAERKKQMKIKVSQKFKDVLFVLVLLSTVFQWGYLAFTHLDYTPQMLFLNYWYYYLIGAVSIVVVYVIIYGKEGGK